MKRAATAVVACFASIAALALVLAAAGAAPVPALETMFRGAAGTPFAAGETLLKTTPLLLTGLAICIAFRAGVWNIGGEGQFILGGLAALTVAQAMAPGGAAVAMSVAAGAVAGALWAGVASLLRITRNAPEVLTTILLNFVAIHLLGWLVNDGPLQEVSRQYPQSDPIPAASALAVMGPGRLHTGFMIGLAAACGVWWFLFHTHAGLRLRASGSSPRAARFAGIDVSRQAVIAMMSSGALAGLAGAVELLGVTGRLYERFASGYGYSGIAVALVAQLNPLGSIASAIFFGALGAGAGELQRQSEIPASIALLAQGIAILVLLVVSTDVANRAMRLFRRAPAAGERVS